MRCTRAIKRKHWWYIREKSIRHTWNSRRNYAQLHLIYVIILHKMRSNQTHFFFKSVDSLGETLDGHMHASTDAGNTLYYYELRMYHKRSRFHSWKMHKLYIETA